MTRRFLIASALLFAACGDPPVTPNQDAAPPDGAPPDDAAIDALFLPTNHAHFVVDRLLVPATNTQARTYAIDLNGDVIRDNQLGTVFATFAGMGHDSQPHVDTVIDTGAAIMLADLGADDLVTQPIASFTMWQGANPTPPACTNAADTVCRKHLTGSATFSLKQGAPVDAPLVGTIAGGTLTAGPGHLTIQFSMLGAAPITATLLGARVELDLTTPGNVTGKLGGAVSTADVDNHLMPAMHARIAAAVQQHCTLLDPPPTCGCAPDTDGKTFLNLFDLAPKDCSVTLAEIRTSSLLVALVSPDVMVEGVMALSFGVGVHVVGGTYTTP